MKIFATGRRKASKISVQHWQATGPLCVITSKAVARRLMEKPLLEIVQVTHSENVTLLLSVQRALTGMITPNMRGVTCSSVDNQITLRFIFESEPTEEDVDRCNIAGTEVAADFTHELVDDEIVIRGASESLNDLSLGVWAFRRYEKQVPQHGAQINLSPDEAVVLFELLSRWSNSKPPVTPDATCYESTAECAVLNNLHCDLERQLAAPFKPDYDLILRRARNALACQWDHPTLAG